MHYKVIARFIAILLIFLGISMAAPLLVGVIYGDGSTFPILSSLMVTTLFGLILFACSWEKNSSQMNHRDGVAIVTLGWVTAALFGTLPYLLSGSIPDFTNAYFESVSGFTTTGASILNDIEGLPEGILFWRSLTQWLGGMGIIVLSIAILPYLGVGGMQLYKAEIPSPVVDKLKPRISETAKSLWKVYVLITVLEILLLKFGGMSLFDSICHGFCTLPTGGFSTKNGSMAQFNNQYYDWVVIFFMLAAGINFSLHYRLLKGDFRKLGGDAELRVFFAIVALFVLVIAFDIYGPVYDSLADAFRYAAFQVSSIITTTGFVTADYDVWPSLSKFILLMSMFLGAMAGSTGGGIKTMRLMLLLKHGSREIFRIVHPHAVTPVKLGGKAVPQDVMSSIWGFFILYIGLFIAATIIMAALGLDLVSAIASVAASIGNIGPGLGIVGPVKNFYTIPFIGKWVLLFCMLLGRLEIYTVIVLMTPQYWRK